jgi:hypothetical protein
MQLLLKIYYAISRFTFGLTLGPLLDSHTLLQPRENDLSPNILDLYSSALPINGNAN